MCGPSRLARLGGDLPLFSERSLGENVDEMAFRYQCFMLGVVEKKLRLTGGDGKEACSLPGRCTLRVPFSWNQSDTLNGG